MRHLISAAAAFVGVLALASGSVSAAEVTLKAVSAFADGTNFSKNFERLIDRVNEQGKGVIQINYLGGGGKVMSPFELGNAIRTGVVDIGNLPGAFYTNLMPEADALKMLETSLYAIKSGAAWDYFNKLHNEKVNAYFLGRSKATVPFHLYINKLIEARDLTDLKIRVTPIYRAFFVSMGATAVRTAPGEVFTALERGVVDGYGWPIQGIFDLGWHEVTKFRVDPGFYAAAVEILVNLDKWNALDDAQRKVLGDAAEWMERTGDAEDLALNRSESLRQAKLGIVAINFDGAEGRKYLDAAYAEGWKAIIEASPEHGPKLKELLSN
ncbi:MAG: TRAP transporter substrate-binding protein DctP [Proteobacteria bacterium]|nr:TRAP transporter substrate-binding protein DctP [Pseudomonadota bacterium]